MKKLILIPLAILLLALVACNTEPEYETAVPLPYIEIEIPSIEIDEEATNGDTTEYESIEEDYPTEEEVEYDDYEETEDEAIEPEDIDVSEDLEEEE